MNNNHIKYFKVKNFKKFNVLEVKNIGQINLIVGDNNIGKTCFLESLLIDDNIDKLVELVHNTLSRRNVHIHPSNINSKNPTFPSSNYFEFLKNSKDLPLEFEWYTVERKFSYKLEDKNIEELEESDFEKEVKHNFNVGRPQYWLKIFENNNYKELQFLYLDDFKTKFDHGYTPFISKNASFNYDINQYYAEEIGLGENESLKITKPSDITTNLKSLSYDDKMEFLENLKLFFNDIEDVMIKEYFGRDMLSLKLKRNENYTPITYFGDGTNEYIRYLLEILKCKGNRIMIDEIDTGIHYTKLKDFWKNIISLCIKLDVQLFATTHSKECIEAYVKALNETILFAENSKIIKLNQTKQNVKAITYPYNEFEFLVENNSEMR